MTTEPPHRMPPRRRLGPEAAATSPTSTSHTIKVEPPYFDALLNGSKPFEVRRNDRAYQRGDNLRLIEWHDARTGYEDCYKCRNQAWEAHPTGREVARRVTYVYAGDPRWPGSLGIGVVVLGLTFACTSCGGTADEPGCCRNPNDGTGFHTALSGIGAAS